MKHRQLTRCSHLLLVFPTVVLAVANGACDNPKSSPPDPKSSAASARAYGSTNTRNTPDLELRQYARIFVAEPHRRFGRQRTSGGDKNGPERRGRSVVHLRGSVSGGLPVGAGAAAGVQPRPHPGSRMDTPVRAMRAGSPPRSTCAPGPGRTRSRPGQLHGLARGRPACSAATMRWPVSNRPPCSTASFHTSATLTRGGRRRRLNFPPHWPWTGHIQAIFQRLSAPPAPELKPAPPVVGTDSTPPRLENGAYRGRHSAPRACHNPKPASRTNQSSTRVSVPKIVKRRGMGLA